jgi:hypothetical protein
MRKPKLKRIVATVVLMYLAQSIVKLGMLRCGRNIIVKMGKDRKINL